NQNWIQYAVEDVMPQAVATGLFDSLCTIQKLDGSINFSGQMNAIWITVFDSILCIQDPSSVARIVATEKKSVDDVESFNMRHVLLNGYYPTITTDMRAVVVTADGFTTIYYDILGVESDSQAQMTRLEVRTATQSIA